MAVAVFAVALAKVTWISKQYSLCIVEAAEAMVKGLALEVLVLGIARIVGHLLEVVPGAAADFQLPTWAISIGQS